MFYNIEGNLSKNHKLEALISKLIELEVKQLI